MPGLDGTPVRGCAVLYGTLYAWRDFDVATQKVYKATAAGWVEVPLLKRVAFTAGTTAYTEGSTLSRGGVTATVRRVVVQSGDWSGGSPASGWLIISDVSGGSFTAGVAGGGGVCTLSGAEAQITLTAGGRWELKPYNFFGGLTMRLYGADGVNDLIEFDGTVLVPIPVAGMTKKPSMSSSTSSSSGRSSSPASNIPGFRIRISGPCCLEQLNWRWAMRGPGSSRYPGRRQSRLCC